MQRIARHIKGLGNATVYMRLRGTGANYYDFVAAAYVASETADCKSFGTEVADSSLSESDYLFTFTPPIGSYLIEYVDGTIGSVFAVELWESVWDEVLTKATHNIPNSAGRRLRSLSSRVISEDTAQAQTGVLHTDIHQIILAAGESAIDDIYVDNIITIESGTGAGQSRRIVDYHGDTKVAYIQRHWTVLPDDTSEYVITAQAGMEIAHMGHLQAGSANSVTLDLLAPEHDNSLTGCYLTIVAGDGHHQTRTITSYNGTTKVAGVSPAFTQAPNATSGFTITSIPPEFISPVGIHTVTVQFYRTATTTPIPDVLCDVYDSTETVRLNGTQLKSAVNGQATFGRDNGTYKVRAMLAGFTFTTGTVVVADGNATLTMYGAAITIPNPPVAGTQTLYGNVRELDWGVATGDAVKAIISAKGQVVNGALIQYLNLSTTVDANSQFSLTVPKGATIRLSVKDHAEHTITINQEDTYDVATYLTE